MLTLAPFLPSTAEANQDGGRLGASPRRPPPRRVDHTYSDFSHVTAAGLPRKKSAANFPSKLHQILSTDEFEHVSLCK